METRLDLNQSGVLKASAEGRGKIYAAFANLYNDFATERIPLPNDIDSFASVVAISRCITKKKLPDSVFSELSQLFASYSSRNDILFYDNNNELSRLTSSRIGVLGLYSIGIHGDILYDHPFNILYDNKASNRPMHSAFVFDDYVFDFVLGVNGEHICKYLANMYISNPGVRLSIWSSCKSAVTSFLNKYSSLHDGINTVAYKRLCNTVSTDYFEQCSEDLYFSNISYGKTNPNVVTPIVESSSLSVKPKEKKPKAPKKLKADKDSVLKAQEKATPEIDITAGITKSKTKSRKTDTIDGISREEGMSRRTQKAMIEDIRSQLAAAIALCEN